MINTRNHYVYIWSEPGTAGSGVPFYVGQGQHRPGRTHKTKYKRAYAKHKTHCSGVWQNTPAQDKFEAISACGQQPQVAIHTDDLTKDEADALEILLIERLGRVIAGTGVLLNQTSGTNEFPATCAYTRDTLFAAARHPDAVARRVSSFKSWINDPDKSAEWRKTVASPEHSVKLSKAQGTSIEYNGVLFPSIRKLAEHLGTDHALIRNRIKRGVPLDTPADPKYANRVSIEYKGKMYTTYGSLAREIGIPQTTLVSRINRGYPLDAPVRRRDG